MTDKTAQPLIVISTGKCIMRKCASCDQYGGGIYCAEDDAMYCAECYQEKLIEDEYFLHNGENYE